MSDKDNFLDSESYIKFSDVKRLIDDLKSARTARGWSNDNSTVSPETSYSLSRYKLNDVKDMTTYNNQGVRYKNTFPSFTVTHASDDTIGSLMLANYLNEIQLVINDTKNLVGCSSGCIAICIGCSGTCSGSSCSGSCGSGCTGECDKKCTGSCGSGCTGTCSDGCGGTCASSCSSCYGSCKVGSIL